MGPPKRLRTEPITRVRTGCFTCRRRKKRCDELKPVCGGCVRNKLDCQWPANIYPEIEQTSRPRSTSRDQSAQTVESITGVDVDGSSGSSGSGFSNGLDYGSPRSIGSFSVSYHPPPFSPAGSSASVRATSIVSSVAARTTFPWNQEQEGHSEDVDGQDSQYNSPISPRGSSSSSRQELLNFRSSVVMRPHDSSGSKPMSRKMSLLPGYDEESYQLLNHYLATTADCMANGSTPVNPFLVHIVPQAFSSDLLLQLVLTQSAAHRAFRYQRDVDTVAQSHYTKALQRFRKGVTEFIDGKESNPLMLTIGALLMCFTETAKGDMNGAIFDHLSAANSLLLRLLAQNDSAVRKDLKEFVIEYYTYTASVSMISIDARVSPQVFLNFDLEQRARDLLRREYVGNLCGCWLELLLLIPCIFALGRQWMMMDNDVSGTGTGTYLPVMPTADDIAMFGSLQAQILRWAPYASVTPEVALAGKIFQQAMLLYLYTAASCYQRLEGGMYQAMINASTTEAMSYLDQLSATVRINSGLCWPIAVVGSCLTDRMQQGRLRQRLGVMVSTFGLGNMQRTLLLLENMWQAPLEGSGPWNICRVMQQHRIWISFA